MCRDISLSGVQEYMEGGGGAVLELEKGMEERD